MFSSITFIDDAMRNPGDQFEYAIRTKFEDTSVDAVISDSVRFKTQQPETSTVSLKLAPPANLLRTFGVCAQLLRKRSKQYSVSEVIKASEEPKDLAAYMYVWHSNQANTEKRSAAYRMTDQLFDTHVDMESESTQKLF